MTKTTSRVLRIISGLHEHADAVIPVDRLLMLGCADDCDIRLADSGIAPHHCCLLYINGRVSLRTVAGRIKADNVETVKGENMILGDRQVVTVPDSDVSFMIEPAADEPLSSDTTDNSTSPRHGVVTRLAMLGAGLSIACVLYAHAVAGGNSDDLAPPAASLSDVIERLELTSKIAVTAPNEDKHIPTVSGVLNATEAETLKSQLSGEKLRVDWEITYVNELLNNVENVFRINGYSVKLEYKGNAEVTVLNLNGSDPGVVNVAEHVHADVAALKKLHFPVDTAGPSEDSPSLYALLPGKRLTTIVDGGTAYVATEDGSRYFIGSVLPGGSQIRSISEAGVQVDHDGTLTWMRF